MFCPFFQEKPGEVNAATCLAQLLLAKLWAELLSLSIKARIPSTRDSKCVPRAKRLNCTGCPEVDELASTFENCIPLVRAAVASLAAAANNCHYRVWANKLATFPGPVDWA